MDWVSKRQGPSFIRSMVTVGEESPTHLHAGLSPIACRELTVDFRRFRWLVMLPRVQVLSALGSIGS